MLKLGEKIISDIYLGDKKIAKVFLGDKLVYQANKPIFLDYISFDGNSWIDIGYKPTNNTKVVGKFSITKFKGNGANYVFGVFGDSANYGLNIGSDRSKLNVPWASSSAIAMDNPNNFNQVYSFDISKNGVYIDGEQKITASQLTATFTATKTFFIGWSNGTSVEKLIGNIYPVQIYENDVLVRDLRPCVIGGVVGLYDMVTGKFHTNIGTGTLKASGRFVESIYFDGNSYINTGIALQTCTIETAVKYESGHSRRMLSGWVGDYGLYWGMQTNGSFELAGSSLSQTTNLTDYTVVKIKYDLTTNVVTPTVDDVTQSFNITVTNTKPYTIGCSTPTSPNKVIGNVYYHRFTNADGELIQDLRPYVDENGKACFKDIVTGNLFYNQGTGTLGYTE